MGLGSGPPRVYNPRMKTRMLLVIAAVVGFRLTLPAQTVQFIVVDRQTNYVQTTAGTAAFNGATPYEFTIDLNGASLPSTGFSFDFKKPGDASTVYTGYERDVGKEWQAPSGLTGQFSSMANLHSMFPDGSYTLLVTGFPNTTLSIPNLIGSTNDGFGNMPFVTATQDSLPVAWSGNRMIVDPTKDLLLQSNVFGTNYAAGQGRIGLMVSGDTVNQESTNEITPGSFTFSGNSVQLLVAGGTLTSGQTYYGNLEFNNIVTSLVDLSATYGAGAQGVSVYTAMTKFEVQAVPEPATYAAWAALLALGAAICRRRHA